MLHGGLDIVFTVQTDHKGNEILLTVVLGTDRI
jgi:hypothetical protein